MFSTHSRVRGNPDRPRRTFGDNDVVRVETYSAELNLRQPQEIDLHTSIFAKLATVVSYGIAARAIAGDFWPALTSGD